MRHVAKTSPYILAKWRRSRTPIRRGAYLRRIGYAKSETARAVPRLGETRGVLRTPRASLARRSRAFETGSRVSVVYFWRRKVSKHLHNFFFFLLLALCLSSSTFFGIGNFSFAERNDNLQPLEYRKGRHHSHILSSTFA